MTASREAEQHTLEQRVAELRTIIAAERETALNADHFLTLLRKYTGIPERTAEIIREFVEKVYVYKDEKVDGQRVQRVKIIYNCIAGRSHKRKFGIAAIKTTMSNFSRI